MLLRALKFGGACINRSLITLALNVNDRHVLIRAIYSLHTLDVWCWLQSLLPLGGRVQCLKLVVKDLLPIPGGTPCLARLGLSAQFALDLLAEAALFRALLLLDAFLV
jgi:hypothetical protein